MPLTAKWPQKLIFAVPVVFAVPFLNASIALENVVLMSDWR
jgi:hypothetical protein